MIIVRSFCFYLSCFAHFLFLLFLKINELKKIHQAGGRAVFTWQKMPNDKYFTMAAVGLVTIGLVQLIPGYYRLASGKGKME